MIPKEKKDYTPEDISSISKDAKVKHLMVMFLESTDPEYLDRIYDGPHMPTKLSVAVGDEPQKMIPK